MARLSDRVVRWLSARIFYGWVVVALAFLALFASGAAQSHTFSVFLGPVSADLGLSQTEWGAAFGLATLVAALGLPYMGRMIDSRGPRTMMMWVAFGLGLACFTFSMAGGIASLAIVFAILRFLGQGSLMLNASNLVSRWFDKRRGFAVSLMGLGFSASMGVHPPMMQWLTDEVGWRQAWFLLGISTWILLIPVVYFLARELPSQLGLEQDGGNGEPAIREKAAASSPVLTGLTRSEALRTPAFYIICCGLFTLSMLVTTLHLFQVSIFEAHGVDRTIAARVFPVSAMTMVVMMPLIGLILDRFPTPAIFGFAQVVMVSSLIAVTFVTDLKTALIYALIFGLNNACTITLFAYIWPRYFGLLHLGSIQGIGQMIGVVGASLGALPLGIAFDLFASYDATLRWLGVQPALCIGLAFCLRFPASLKRQVAAQNE